MNNTFKQYFLFFFLFFLLNIVRSVYIRYIPYIILYAKMYGGRIFNGMKKIGVRFWQNFKSLVNKSFFVKCNKAIHYKHCFEMNRYFDWNIKKLLYVITFQISNFNFNVIIGSYSII